MRLHIAHGRLIDPANGVDGRHDLFVADGRVVAVDAAPDGFHADRVLDASGLAVLPGWFRQQDQWVSKHAENRSAISLIPCYKILTGNEEFALAA